MTQKSSWLRFGVLGAAVCILLLLVRGEAHRMQRDARMAQCRANLKQIGFALHNYHSAYGHLPAVYGSDKAGPNRHSWRVTILPFLGSESFYAQYHFDQPWNSLHNRALADVSGPPCSIMTCPLCTSQRSEKHTDFVAIVGENTVFGNGPPRNITKAYRESHPDKIVICEYNRSGIVWTEPRDVTLDEIVHAYCRPGSVHTCDHSEPKHNRRFIHVFRMDGATERLSLPADRSKLIERLTY